MQEEARLFVVVDLPLHTYTHMDTIWFILTTNFTDCMCRHFLRPYLAEKMSSLRFATMLRASFTMKQEGE